MKQKRILVTGPDGFVGTKLCKRLLGDGFTVRGAQFAPAQLPEGCESVVVGDLAAATNWAEAMQDVDLVVHLAARVHIMDDQSDDPLREFRHVNVEGTRAVAEAAVQAGVKRLVFISSIKVLGEATEVVPFKADDKPAPEDPYGVSKMEAEQVLREISAADGLEVTIVRPPLVYGPGVRANFEKLLGIVAKGIPLPFGRVKNQRSLVAVDNLIDFLACCLTHPRAGDEAFLVSDGQDLSTADLVRAIACAFERPARLLPVPPPLMKWAGSILRKRAQVDRLLGSLAVDIAKNRELLNWNPPVSVDNALKETTEWYLSEVRGRTTDDR